MRDYNPWQPLFSLHIPKCGGTSFTKILRDWFWPCFHAHYIAHDQGGTMPKHPSLARKLIHLSGYRRLCIHGHFESNAGLFDYYPNAKQFITIIRDPLDMQLSLYWDHVRRIKEHGTLYWKGKNVEMEYDGDLDRWVAERPSYLLAFLPFEFDQSNFREVLSEKFIHIGVLGNIQKSVDIFAEKLNKQSVPIETLNISERSRKPSDTAVQTFKEKHQLEYEIYEWVKTLNNV